MDVESALRTLLDHVDYTAGNCAPNEMVGALVPAQVINLCREALKTAKEVAMPPPPTIKAGFGVALDAVKAGFRAARVGWNGKGMFIFLVPGSTFTVNRPPLLGIYPEGTRVNYHAHIDMKTADGTVVPWLASQTDLLAEDWMILPVEA
jgi:hypothetical protein